MYHSANDIARAWWMVDLLQHWKVYTVEILPRYGYLPAVGRFHDVEVCEIKSFLDTGISVHMLILYLIVIFSDSHGTFASFFLDKDLNLVFTMHIHHCV